MARAPRESPRDGLAIALPVVLVALLLLGAVAVALAAAREHDEAEKNQQEVTELVRTDVSATVDELVATLAGAPAIVDETGFPVPIERWRLFAQNATSASVMESLALVLSVPDDQRRAFEAAFDTPIRQVGPDGLVVADRRDSYLPIRDVYPITDESRQLLGFDIASDPTRRVAADLARARSNVIVSAPVLAQPTGRPAFFVVMPLVRPSAWSVPPTQRSPLTIGFITTAVTGDTIVQAALPLLPPDTRFAIEDEGVLLGSTDPAPAGDRTTTLDVAGRRWVIEVDAGDQANYSLAWIIAIATVAVAGAIAYVLRTRIRAQRSEAADAARHARSADLAQRLAEARTTTAVAEAVHQEVPLLLGAANATVRTLDDTQKLLRAVIDEELPTPLAEADDIPVEVTNPAGRAVVERRWILLHDVGEQRSEYGTELADAVVAAGYGSLACIPLGDIDGAAAGLLAVAWRDPEPFDETTMALLRTVAETCEQTLERARLHDSEHLLVQRLQTATLSDPPTLAGLDMAVRYQSAVQTLSMGGDWYDTVVLDERTVALVVGDVSGHGVPAIAEMIELRSAMHALLRARHPIDDVLAVADGILSNAGRTRIATALVAVFDSAAQQVQYVSAGHPPALICSPDGSVEVVMDGRRTVLGLTPRTGEVVAARPFPPGSTFVAYTDGLVERRSEDLLESIDRLAHQVAGPVVPCEQLADSILVAHASDAADDDIALVVVRAT